MTQNADSVTPRFVCCWCRKEVWHNFKTQLFQGPNGSTLLWHDECWDEAGTYEPSPTAREGAPK